jgi:CheY-like chemotaxis protein
MKREVTIVLAEDDDGHASLIKKNLQRAGIDNAMLHFRDGEETLNFFFRKGEGPHLLPGTSYILLLDIRMPKIDGLEVLRQLKGDNVLHKVPVLVITTTEDPDEVERCHELGCNVYIPKPIDYERFVLSMNHLGLFLRISEFPKLNGFRG